MMGIHRIILRNAIKELQNSNVAELIFWSWKLKGYTVFISEFETNNKNNILLLRSWSLIPWLGR